MLDAVAQALALSDVETEPFATWPAHGGALTQRQSVRLLGAQRPYLERLVSWELWPK
ncbi:hypothetical protein [Streptomyces sp. NPDC101776]|uniref:hypothetical protein n=1 Tax=Streptomyces sp. NPDC101776 TaxID=3366146 RepID=UPI0037F999B3